MGTEKSFRMPVVRSLHPTLTPASSPIDGKIGMAAFLHFLLNEGDISTGNPRPRFVYTVRHEVRNIRKTSAGVASGIDVAWMGTGLFIGFLCFLLSSH